MLKQEWVDHLYDYIEIEDDIYNVLKIQGIKEKFERLDNLYQLGFAHKVFPRADHKKLNHNLGTYYLAKSLIENDILSAKSVNNHSFKFAALIHGIGHFAFSLSTEIALQKGILLENSIESQLSNYLADILKELYNLNIIKSENLKEYIEGDRNINDFYRLFTLNSLLNVKKDIKRESDNKINFPEVCKYLIETDNLGYKLLNLVDRLDFILRDMYNLGFIKLELNIPYFLKNIVINNSSSISYPSEWQAIKSIERYAVYNIYNNKKIKYIDSIYQTHLLDNIFKGEIGPTHLYEKNDINMTTFFKKHNYPKFSILLNNFKERPHYDLTIYNKKITIGNIIKKTGRQKSIGKSLKKDISRQVYNNVYKGAFTDTFSTNGNISINILCNDTKNIKRFLYELAKYENYYNINQKEKIAELLFGESLVELQFKRFRSFITYLFNKLKNEKEDFDPELLFSHMIFINSKSIETTEFEKVIMENMQGNFGRMLANYADFDYYDLLEPVLLSDIEKYLNDKKIIKYLGFKDHTEFLEYIDNFIKRNVKKVKDFKETGLEYYYYIYNFLKEEDRNDLIKKWILPSVKTKRCEEDIVVLKVFKNKLPVLKLNACSTSDSQTKINKDIVGLEQMKYLIEERFQNKITVISFFNEEKLNL